VDDNFVGNRKAARGLLQELVRWQQERYYPLRFGCEATLNLAREPELLELMRAACFSTVFCGIETPEESALKFIRKEQNLQQPILDSVRTLNRYGLEVFGGIIFGLDTDSLHTGDRIWRFIEASNIPMLTINILQALPKTPLWRRLESAGRLRNDSCRDSNVDFLLPYDSIVAMWRECVLRSYTPDALYKRLDYQVRYTYPNRLKVPAAGARLSWANIRRGFSLLASLFWHVGVRADYRRRFWQTARPAIRNGRIVELIVMAVQAHHMILYARDCARDEVRKCLYDPRPEKPQATR
jgi:radical SAM superfamily enzyme YgiQ (UPF0313 family)